MLSCRTGTRSTLSPRPECLLESSWPQSQRTRRRRGRGSFVLTRPHEVGCGGPTTWSSPPPPQHHELRSTYGAFPGGQCLCSRLFPQPDEDRYRWRGRAVLDCNTRPQQPPGRRPSLWSCRLRNLHGPPQPQARIPCVWIRQAHVPSQADPQWVPHQPWSSPHLLLLAVHRLAGGVVSFPHRHRDTLTQRRYGNVWTQKQHRPFQRPFQSRPSYDCLLQHWWGRHQPPKRLPSHLCCRCKFSSSSL